MMRIFQYLLYGLNTWHSDHVGKPGLLQQDVAKHRSPVRFEVHITAGKVGAIGAGPREGILVNGTFIGPTLRLNQGDDVEFLVRNHLGRDTSMHFHGIGQRSTPWSDGVPGLTQRQIRPGASFLYRWTADEAGAFFYHAHSRGQLMDGLYGAIVVSAPAEAERPFCLIDGDGGQDELMRAAELGNQPLLVADWSQYKFDDFYRIEQAANFDLACTDAIIVNGVGSQYCLNPVELDNMTNPVILQMLKSLGEDHLTAKGCIPPIQALQGNFDVDVGKLPLDSVRECARVRNAKGNYTFNVDEKLGWAALTFINAGGLYPLQISIDNHKLYVYAVDGQYTFTPQPRIAYMSATETGFRSWSNWTRNRLGTPSGWPTTSSTRSWADLPKWHTATPPTRHDTRWQRWTTPAAPRCTRYGRSSRSRRGPFPADRRPGTATAPSS